MSNQGGSSQAPLQYQRAFGAGLKRKHIDFVPQSIPSNKLPVENKSSKSAEDFYLSIVLPTSNINHGGSSKFSVSKSNDSIKGAETTLPACSTSEELTTPGIRKDDSFCDICGLSKMSSTANSPHEASLTHQICLNHVHPPSSIDRRRKGLKYLRSQGWDLDARLGLGPGGEGMLYPIQPKINEGKTGIGAKPIAKEEQKKVRSMGAKEARAHEADAQKRGKIIEQILHGEDQLNKYLGIDL